MPFVLTNAPAVFIELMSQSKEEYESHVKMIMESLKEEKMYVKFSNNVEAEQRGSYLKVEVEYQGSSGLLLQPELPE
ncbi:hypothetical protein Tco_0785879 [Tanacetum coccineum]